MMLPKGILKELFSAVLPLQIYLSSMNIYIFVLYLSVLKFSHFLRDVDLKFSKKSNITTSKKGKGR